MVGYENPLSLRRPQTFIKLSTRLKLVNLVTVVWYLPGCVSHAVAGSALENICPPLPTHLRDFSHAPQALPLLLSGMLKLFFFPLKLFSLFLLHRLLLFLPLLCQESMARLAPFSNDWRTKKSLFLLIFLKESIQIQLTGIFHVIFKNNLYKIDISTCLA